MTLYLFIRDDDYNKFINFNDLLFSLCLQNFPCIMVNNRPATTEGCPSSWTSKIKWKQKSRAGTEHNESSCGRRTVAMPPPCTAETNDSFYMSTEANFSFCSRFNSQQVNKYKVPCSYMTNRSHYIIYHAKKEDWNCLVG